MPPSTSNPPNKLGPWVVGKEIGRGEFSKVFEAELVGREQSDGNKVTFVLKLAVAPSSSGAKSKKASSTEDAARLLSL